MTTAAPWARFDDLRRGTALRCPPARQVLTATRPQDVVPVLAEVDRVTADGSWAFGYVGYEAAAGLGGGLAVAEPSGDGPPLVWFGICGPPEEVPVVGPGTGSAGPVPHWVTGWSDDEHAAAVALIREAIAAGETYQCNLTDRLHARLPGDLPGVYADLARAQAGAHNAYLDLGRHAVLSASPELFFDWTGTRLRTRPMKGTAARGRTTAEDRRQADRLRSSPKERAENLMIVDLLRNDLARIARTGSVQVPELWALERYPTVWQLVSEITAEVGEDVGLVDVFRALFPCGSVTGAPKQRTMELIRDLEAGPRGIYCGAIGLVAPPGAPFRARFGVAIRTVVVDRGTGSAVYGAGGGITWDSDPAAERAELLAKTAVLTERPADHQLIETLRHCAGEGPRNLDRHLARLVDSADYFGFPCDPDDVRRRITAALAGRTGDARVRILLGPSGAVSVEVGRPPPDGTGPVRLAVDAEPVDSTSRWYRHKTTRRDDLTDRAARHPEADDVVVVNERGEVAQTTIASLAVRLGGTWWTPPVSSGALPGVERARLLEAGRLRERVIRVTDLAAADGLAVVSSLRGWRPALTSWT